MIHYSSLVLRSRCLRSAEMWRFQVSLLSRCNPRYLTSPAWGMLIWLKISWGQFPLLCVKVTCLDFSFIFILHLRVHFSRFCRWVCRFSVAVRVTVNKEKIYCFLEQLQRSRAPTTSRKRLPLKSPDCGCQPLPTLSLYPPHLYFFLHQLYGYNSPLWNNLTIGQAKLANYSSTAVTYHIILT
jgi:hypothetical protein